MALFSNAVVKLTAQKNDTGIDTKVYCRHLDVVLHYPLIGRLKGAFAGESQPFTSSLRVEFATSDCTVELPYDWDVDRGSARLGWAEAVGALDTSRVTRPSMKTLRTCGVLRKTTR